MPEADILFRQAQIVSPWGVRPGDVAVRGGKISAITLPGEGPSAARTLDAAGKHLLPGVIDPHVHLTSAGKTLEQSCRDETPSMALGGVTTCLHFAQTTGSYHPLFAEAPAVVRECSLIDVGLHAILMTEEHVAELPEYARRHAVRSFKMYMAAGGAELYPGTLSVDDGLVFRAMGVIREMGAPALAMVHAENWEIARALEAQLRAAGRHDAAAWTDARPALCEEETMQRAIYLARQQRCPLYIVHCSIGQAGQVVAEGRARGVPVIGETCPHYLTIHRDHERAILAKYNPAVKEAHDLEGLWAGLREGLISTVGSDHIPVRAKDKDLTGKDIWTARGGAPGSGTILPVLLSEGVHRGRLSIEQVAAVTSYNAARTFGLYPRKGAIAVGADADLVLVDLERELTLRPEQLGLDFVLFDGWTFHGWPELTMVRGQIVVEDATLVGQPGSGRYVHEEPAAPAA
jgi:dihydroorotase-like cyclic amidohydrolase